MVNELTSDLKSNLVTPLIHFWHGNVIQEDSEVLFAEWEVVLCILPFDFTADGILEVVWEGVEREVDSLGRVLLCIHLAEMHQDYGCLASSDTTDEKGILNTWLLSLFRSHVWK